jgi:hypothetical protein
MENIANYERNKISGNFQGSLPVEYPPKTKYFSPDGQYFFELEVFSKPINDGVTFGSYFFAKVAVFDQKTQEKLFETLNNHSGSPHQWLTIDGKTYLFFAEFLQGMTVYNMTDRIMTSHLAESSLCQIIQYFPSPDGLKMATVQYDGHNLEILLYDISKPMELPFLVVFKKKIEYNNGKIVKTIDWHGNNINIVHEEYVQICNQSIKVQVVGVTEDKWRGKCRFEDIYGNEYFCYEKCEAIGFFPDDNTIFPFESGICVNVIKIFSQNNQKIAKIEVEIGYLESKTIQLDVFEHQVETYWHHQY